MLFDRTSQTPPGPFNIDIGTTELLRLNASGGNDVITRRQRASTVSIESELNGDDGNDDIRGTDAEDRINGGAGRDLVNSVDKAEDLVDCGTGIDLALVDRRDFVRGCNIVIGGCLKVKRPGSRQSSPTTASRRCGSSAPARSRCKGTVRLRSGGKTIATKKFNITNRSKTID